MKNNQPTRYNFQTGQYETLPDGWMLPEHDDLMDADDYDRRRAERDGWETVCWDGR